MDFETLNVVKECVISRLGVNFNQHRINNNNLTCFSMQKKVYGLKIGEFSATRGNPRLREQLSSEVDEGGVMEF